MRWFSGLFSILGSFIAYYPKKKNWNPDWYIKWIGDWPSVSALVFRPENPPSLFCGNPPSLNWTLSCSTQKEWGHSARPPALLDVSPCLYQELATRRQPYYFSTHNADLTQVWSYETFFVIETVIDRYLAVETWEGLNKIIIMIQYIHNTLISNKFNKYRRWLKPRHRKNISVSKI